MLSGSLKMTSRKRAKPSTDSVSNNNNNINNNHYDLPISTEMVSLLENALNRTDEDGVLDTAVGSHLSQPLSIESLFYPTAALVNSTFAAAKLPSYASLQYSNKSNSNYNSNNNYKPSASLSHDSIEISLSNNNEEMANGNSRIAISDYSSRLNVLWLRRKAELQRSEGMLVDAASTVEAAIAEHLGPNITADNYTSANLSAPSMTNDPFELLAKAQETFFLFEPKIHNIADKIQRWYRRRFAKKVCLINKIIKWVRGFLVRHRMRKLRSVKVQCAKLIQRRFRKHLVKMHRLATRIKQWYKSRKAVNAYKKRLFLYQMARRIQKFARGFLGRRKAALVLLKRRSCIKIQKWARRYAYGSCRNFIISRIHRKFFFAARKIQRVVRAKQAIERCRIKLLLELLRENLRFKKETIVIQELLRNERIKHNFYLKSKFGSLQMKWHQHRVKAKEDLMTINKKKLEEKKTQKSDKKDKTKSSKKSQSKKEETVDVDTFKFTEENPLLQPQKADSFISPQVITIVDMFDEFDDGRVPWQKITSLLSQLSVSFNDELLDKLKIILDAQDNGFFYLSEFLTWFDSPEADKFIIVPLKFSIKFDSIWLTKWKAQKKAKHKLLQEEMVTRFYRSHFMTLFRRQSPPKFQCCQCRQSFALFTDYHFHFEMEGNVGVCPVNRLKSLFFPKYWQEKGAWQNQREIEFEIARVNSEYSFVQFFVKFHCMEELQCWSDFRVTDHFQWLKERMQHHYNALLKDLAPGEFYKKFCGILLEHLAPTTSVNKINEIMVRMLGKALDLPIKKIWILEEGLNVADVEAWVTENLPYLFDDIFEEKKKPVKVKKEVKGPDASISDYGSNQNVFKQKKKKPKRNKKAGAAGEISDEYMENVEYYNFKKPLFKFSQKAKFAEAMNILSSLVIRIIRLRIVESQTALISLLEFRGLVPRRITVADSTLESLELHSLTTTRFKRDYEYWINLYDSSMQQYKTLRSLEAPPVIKTCLKFASKLLSLKTITLATLDTESRRNLTTADNVNGHVLHDSYTFACAKEDVINRSPLGKENLLQVAKQSASMTKFCKKYNHVENLSVLQKVRSKASISDFLSIMVGIHIKYVAMQNSDPTQYAWVCSSPQYYDSKSIDKDDIVHLLQAELTRFFDLSNLQRLDRILDNEQNISITDIVNSALQLKFQQANVFSQVLQSCKQCLPSVFHHRYSVEDARNILEIRARSEMRLQTAIIHILPRTAEDQPLLWSKMSEYYQHSPQTFWYPLRTQLQPQTDALLAEFRSFHGWKQTKEIMKCMKIRDIQQTSAHRRAWFRSRITRKGRKIIKNDAILVDVADVFIKALLSVAVVPTSQEALHRLMSSDVKSNTSVNRYFQRLLASVVEIWTRLMDTTCRGTLDGWEEKEFNNLLESASFMSTISALLWDPPKKAGLTSKAQEWRAVVSPTMMCVRPLSQVAVDALQHSRWTISSRSKSIVMNVPNRNSFSRIMLISAQRRIAKQLTEQALSYSEFPEPNESQEDDQNAEPVGFNTMIKTSNVVIEKQRSLLLRSQLLAMRQVKMFLKRSIGKVYCHLSVMREVEQLWNSELLTSFPPLYTMWKKFTATYGFDVDNNNYGLPKTAAIIRDTIGVGTSTYPKCFTKQSQRQLKVEMLSYLRYCFFLHCERQTSEHAMMLTTELSHVIYFIRCRQPTWVLNPVETIPVIRMIRKSFSGDGIFWLDCQRFCALMLPLFTVKVAKSSRKDRSWTANNSTNIVVPTAEQSIALIDMKYTTLYDDAMTRVYSRARQQAVLITSNTQDVTVAETNYRCLVLGLYDVAKHVHMADVSPTLLKTGDLIPKELVPIYMLSTWFDIRDIFLYSHSYVTTVQFEDVMETNTILSNELDSQVKSAVVTQGSAEERLLEKRNALFRSFGNSSLNEILPTRYQQGNLDSNLVDIGNVDTLLKEKVWNEFSYIEAAKRRSSHGRTVSTAVVERIRLLAAFNNKFPDVESRGAQHLREIISGISQFSQL